MNITSPIAKKLQQLIDIKKDLNTSINNKGANITDKTLFKDYASEVDTLEIKDPLIEQELEILKKYIEEEKKNKAYLLEVIYAKNPDFEQIINIDSSLKDIANIVLAIGAMNMTFREKLNPIIISKNYTVEGDLKVKIKDNLVNYLETPNSMPVREIIENITIAPPNKNININL